MVTQQTDPTVDPTPIGDETIPGQKPTQPDPQPNQPDSDPGQPEPGSRDFPEEEDPDQVGRRDPDGGVEG